MGEKLTDVFKAKNIIPDVIQHRPKEDFGEYCNMSIVKGMIKDSTAYILDYLPKLNDKLTRNQNTIRDFQSSQKGILTQLEDMKTSMKELNLFEQKMQQINVNIKGEVIRNQEKFTSMENTLHVQNTNLQKYNDDIQRIWNMLEQKDLKINKVEQIMDGRADDLKKQFDKFFKNISKDFKVQQKSQETLQARVEKVMASTDSFARQMKANLSDTIKDYGEKQRLDQAKITQIEFEMFNIKKVNRKVEQMQIQFEGLQGHIAASAASNLFISKSLPILTHLQICEAIQEISGTDYQHELINFERKKIKELADYSKLANFGCINSMHQRLMSYAVRMSRIDKGCSTITFGEDIKPEMSEEEASFFNKSYEIGIEKRFQAMLGLQTQLKDAYDLLIREKHRNFRMIQYKLRDIDAGLVGKLRKKILQHKVKDLKDYSDLDCIYSDEAMQVKAIASANSLEGGKPGGGQASSRGTVPGPNGSSMNIMNIGQIVGGGISSQFKNKSMLNQKIEFPKEIFVWRRDKMRNYLRFNNKFEMKFEMALEMLNNIRQGFQKQQEDGTKLQLELSLEFNQLKTVMGELQDSFDTLEDSQTQLFVSFDQQEQSINQLRKELATQKTLADVSKKEYRALQKLLQLNQSRNDTNITMVKFDIEESIKRDANVRKEMKLLDNKKQSELADLKMKISQLMQQSTLNAPKVKHLGTIDFANVGKILSGGVDPTQESVELSVQDDTIDDDTKSQKDLTSEQQESTQEKINDSAAKENQTLNIEENNDSENKSPSVIKIAEQESESLEQSPLVKETKSKQTSKAASRKTSKAASRKTSKQNSKDRQKEQETEQEQEKEKEEVKPLKPVKQMSAVQLRIQAALNKEGKRKEAKIMVSKNDASSAIGKKILDDMQAQKDKQAEEQRKLNEKLQKLTTIERVNYKNDIRRQMTLKQAADAAIKKKHEDDKKKQQQDFIDENDELEKGKKAFSKRYGSGSNGDHDKEGLQKLAAMAGINLQGGGGMSEEKFEELLKPKLDQFRASLETGFGSMLKDKLQVCYNAMDQQRVDLEGDLNEQFIKLESKVETNLSNYDMKLDKELKQMQFTIKSIDEQLGQENGEFQKLKRATKSEIRYELEKFSTMASNTENEFQRINLYIENISGLLQLLTEDQMINQLLLEQDILDRKQIGLFGTKKNSQIMGVNQGAMKSNLSTDRRNSNTSVNSSQASPSRKEKDLWVQVPNKNKSYQSVVKGKEPSDYLHKVQQKDQINNLQTIHEKGSIVPEGQSEFQTKYQSDKQYNTLFIDKNCASCNGFAPAVLSQIKLACLSYVNSPISFGKEKLPMSDMVQVKDIMLKKCEMYSNVIDKVKEIPSHYGTMDFISFMKQNRSIDQEQKSYDEHSILLSPNFQGQDISLDAEQDNSNDTSLVAPNKQRRTLQINDEHIDVKSIQNHRLYDKFLKGMKNEIKPKFQIETLTRLILKKNDEIGKASKNISKDLFNILNISESMQCNQFTGPLCQLKTVDQMNLRNIKLRTDNHIGDMAVQYLGADEKPPKLACPPQMKDKKSLSGSKRTTVMTKRNMTICSEKIFPNDMQVFGAQSFINFGKNDHVAKYRNGLKMEISVTPQNKLLAQTITHRVGNKYKARGNSVSGFPKTTFSNTTIKETSNTRAKTPSNFSHGGKGFGYITATTGINHGVFSNPDNADHDTYRNIQDYEQELLHGSKIANNQFTPAMSTFRSPNTANNSIIQNKK